MKKSRSSTPRFDARFPGFAGTAGARDVWVADPRVAIAVGNTLGHQVSPTNVVRTYRDLQRGIRISGETLGFCQAKECIGACKYAPDFRIASSIVANDWGEESHL